MTSKMMHHHPEKKFSRRRKFWPKNSPGIRHKKMVAGVEDVLPNDNRSYHKIKSKVTLPKVKFGEIEDM